MLADEQVDPPSGGLPPIPSLAQWMMDSSGDTPLVDLKNLVKSFAVTADAVKDVSAKVEEDPWDNLPGHLQKYRVDAQKLDKWREDFRTSYFSGVHYPYPIDYAERILQREGDPSYRKAAHVGLRALELEYTAIRRTADQALARLRVLLSGTGELHDVTPQELTQEVCDLLTKSPYPVSISRNCLSFEVHVDLEGIDMGLFVVEIKRFSNHWKVNVSGGNYDNEGCNHPHVINGDLCMGEGEEAFESAMSDGRLFDAVEILAMLLQSYNPSSCYQTLKTLTGGEKYICADCGEYCSEDERFYCEPCGSDVCESCWGDCEVCEEGSCRGCLVRGRCSCGMRYCVCGECVADCPKCLETLCPACLGEWGRHEACLPPPEEPEEPEETPEEGDPDVDA